MLYPIKIEFKDYPSGTWQDWSEYLIEAPGISKKVESESEGEAGVIVFDNASVSLKYDVGSPVYNAFSIDLSSKQRYLFRISAVKTDKTYVQLFEGMADFSTLKWLEYNKVISFEILDKLSALNILQNLPVRIFSTLDARVLAQQPTADGLRFIAQPDGSFLIYAYRYTTFPDIEYLPLTSVILTPGELLLDPAAMDPFYEPTKRYLIVKESWISGDGYNQIRFYAPNDLTFHYDPATSNYMPVDLGAGVIEFAEKEVYGIDILNYSAGIPVSINGFAFIDILIKTAWPEITITYRGISSFNVPLAYFLFLMDENPFGKDPLDALKMLADSMKCYIYVDRTGNVIVQSKSALATSGTTRSIGTTKIISGPEKSYFWDKLADGAEVNVTSWVQDAVTGELLLGSSVMTKQPTGAGFTQTQIIKPKNSIKRDILVGDDTTDTQAELDAFAASEALSILNFYGLRHAAFDLVLNLDDNTINWELIDNLLLDSLTTFFTNLDFDLVERTLTLKPVEAAGHDYDYRSIVVGLSEGNSSGVSTSTSSSSSGGYISSSYIFNKPLILSGGIVALDITDNLKLTTDKLDAAQPIKTTDTPTFNQLSLSSGASSSLNAVRADRILATSYPLTGGGNLTADRTLGLNYNSINLKLTSNALNTIQDIAPTSTTFRVAGLTVTDALTSLYTNIGVPYKAALFQGYSISSNMSIASQRPDLLYLVNKKYTVLIEHTATKATGDPTSLFNGAMTNSYQIDTSLISDADPYILTATSNSIILPYIYYYSFFSFFCNAGWTGTTDAGNLINSWKFEVQAYEDGLWYTVFDRTGVSDAINNLSFSPVGYGGNPFFDNGNRNAKGFRLTIRAAQPRSTGFNFIPLSSIQYFNGNSANNTGNALPLGGGTLYGNLTLSNAVLSITKATGTAPLTIASTTKVNNLNVDMVDGYHFNQSLLTTDSPTFANVGIGTTAIVAKFQVNNKVGDDNHFTYDSNSAMIVHQTPTSSTVLNDPKTVLLLARQGTSEQAYGAGATFNLSRYKNDVTNSKTRLDISLANNRFDIMSNNVLTLLSEGNVGIGTTAPAEKLTVSGNTKQFGDIYSDNFSGVDPYQGYYIGRSGSVFGKITANELYVKSFIADLEQALAGSQIISKSVAKVAVDFTDIVNTYLEVESFEGYPTMAVFADNDIIRLRSFSRTSGGLTILDNWIRVTLATSYNSDGYVNGFNSTTKTQAYSFVQLSGSLIVAKKGTLALDYGQSGDGIIETVAVGVTSGKPYQQIKTWTTAPYTDLTVKYRHGSLAGITDPVLGTLTGYGLYSDNAYLKGKIVATSGKIGDWNLDTKLYNGSTRLEVSASFKGLAVSGLVGVEEFPIDLLKVGQFTLPAMSEYHVSLPAFTYGKTVKWGTFNQTATSATSTSGVVFWSNATGLLMDSFSWSISNASTYLNKFVRIAFNVVVPAGQNGSYFQQTVVVRLLNGSTVIYTETRNGYATGSAYTLSVDETFLCLDSNIQVRVELYSSYGYYNHIPITSINITQAYYIDSTPITEINNGNLRIYDSGGRRSFEYNSTEGIKIKTGFKVGSWFITDGSGSNSLSFYYNNVLVKTLGSDGSWA